MKLSQILDNVKIKKTKYLDCDINDIVYDSRKASVGSIFVCLSGTMADGHNFALSAYKSGVRTFIVERELELPSDAQQIVVDNTRHSLSLMSANFFNHPADEMNIIGITGTKGKTSCAFLIKYLLEENGVKTGIIGTVGAAYGKTDLPTINTTPESYELHKMFRIMADNGCGAVVMEVSSIGLMMNRVDGIEFDVAVFTNLSPDHIGENEHSDYADYTYWKSVLFSRCKKAIINIDDTAAATMTAAMRDGCELITYGLDSRADLWAKNIELLKKERFLGIKFDCNYIDTYTSIEVSLPGDFNVYNTLAAIAVLIMLGYTDKTTFDCLKTAAIKGRGECVDVSPDFDVIIDYAHNGISLKSILETLNKYEHNRLICLYGSVGGRTQMRRKELGLVSGSMCDLSIITSDDPDFEDPMKIIDEISEYVESQGGQYVKIPDRAEAIEYALSIMQKNDILLLAGKGHEQFQKINGVKMPFSEIECIKNYMSKGGF